jgi:hypothetical protein
MTPWSLLLLAAVTGALLLPMNPLMRALWLRSLPDPHDIESSNVFESVMSEAVLLLGRLAVAGVVLVLPIRGAISLQAVPLVVGSLGLVATALLRADGVPQVDSVAYRRVTQIRSAALLFAAFVLFSAPLGAYAVVMIVASGAHGEWASALAVALWGAGSIAGVTLLKLKRFAHNAVGVLFLLIAMGSIQLAGLLANGSLVGILVAATAAGLPIAAIVSGLYAILGPKSQSAHQTEILAWAGTMILGGDAIGALAAGWAFDSASSATAISVGAVCAVLAAGAVAFELQRSTESPVAERRNLHESDASGSGHSLSRMPLEIAISTG